MYNNVYKLSVIAYTYNMIVLMSVFGKYFDIASVYRRFKRLYLKKGSIENEIRSFI